MSATYIAGNLALSTYSGLMPIVIALLVLAHFCIGIVVGEARKKYGIPLPSLYAVAGTPRYYGGKAGDRELEKLAPTGESTSAAALTGAGSAGGGGGNIISDEDAYRFNLLQRGHMNTVENAPFIVAMLLQNWFTFPLPAACCGLLWTVGRVMYFVGYARSPNGRTVGGPFTALGLLGLLGLSITSGVFMLQGRAAY